MQSLSDYGKLANIWWALVVTICLGILIFGISSGFKLDEGQEKFWELTFKIIGGLVALSGASIAFMKYIDEKVKSNETALLEAKKPFYTKRQEVYYDLVSATATMSTREKDEREWVDAENVFWRIYWGTLPLVTDDEVGLATNEFEKAYFMSDDLGEDKFVAMRNSSMALARACRKSLGFADLA